MIGSKDVWVLKRNIYVFGALQLSPPVPVLSNSQSTNIKRNNHLVQGLDPVVKKGKN